MEVVEEELQVQIEIHCPKCQNALLYSPDLEGTRGLCKACNHIFTISSDPVVAASSEGTFPFECPKCRHLFEGKDGMQGKRGKCDQCNEVFEIKPKQGKPAANVRKVERAVIPKNQFSSPSKASVPVQANQAKATPRAAVSSVPQVESDPFAWDSLPIPGANVSGGGAVANYSGYAANPYEASPAISHGYGPAGGGSTGFFESCFKLAHKQIGIVTGMSYLSALVSGGAAILLFIIPALILAFLAEPLGVREWSVEVRIIATVLLYIPAMCVYFYFMPSFWNLALLGVRGKQIEMGSITEYGSLSPLMFVWSLMTWVLPYVLCSLASFLVGLVFAGGVGQLIVGLLGFGLYGLVTLLVSVPLMLVPFAMMDGESFPDAIGLSFRLTYREFGQYYLILFVAGMIGLFATVLTCGLGGTFATAYVLSIQAAFYHRSTSGRR